MSRALELFLNESVRDILALVFTNTRNNYDDKKCYENNSIKDIKDKAMP